MARVRSDDPNFTHGTLFCWLFREHYISMLTFSRDETIRAYRSLPVGRLGALR
jgi:hypothetical protein